ncbi:hypothetical protein ACJJTC_004633 [Scirpophaga incertulas]
MGKCVWIAQHKGRGRTCLDCKHGDVTAGSPLSVASSSWPLFEIADVDPVEFLKSRVALHPAGHFLSRLSARPGRSKGLSVCGMRLIACLLPNLITNQLHHRANGQTTQKQARQAGRAGARAAFRPYDLLNDGADMPPMECAAHSYPIKMKNVIVPFNNSYKISKNKRNMIFY